MSRRTVATEVGVALVLAAVVLVLAPGLAVAAMVALLVLAICGVTLLVDARRARRVRSVRRRPPDRRRAPTIGRSPGRR